MVADSFVLLHLTPSCPQLGLDSAATPARLNSAQLGPAQLGPAQLGPNRVCETVHNRTDVNAVDGHCPSRGRFAVGTHRESACCARFQHGATPAVPRGLLRERSLFENHAFAQMRVESTRSNRTGPCPFEDAVCCDARDPDVFPSTIVLRATADRRRTTSAIPMFSSPAHFAGCDSSGAIPMFSNPAHLAGCDSSGAIPMFSNPAHLAGCDSSGAIPMFSNPAHLAGCDSSGAIPMFSNPAHLAGCDSGGAIPMFSNPPRPLPWASRSRRGSIPMFSKPGSPRGP